MLVGGRHQGQRGSIECGTWGRTRGKGMNLSAGIEAKQQEKLPGSKVYQVVESSPEGRGEMPNSRDRQTDRLKMPCMS